MPSTREEFYNTLKAFKERDPNGNGKADEIPFSSEKMYSVELMYQWWGMGEFYLDNGKVESGWTQPEYKEYIMWLKKLYDEGLIDPDYAITDRTQFDYKVSNGITGSWYGLAGGCLGRLTTLMASVDPEFKISAMPWLASADGNKYVINSEYTTCVSDVGIAVTSKCKNIPEAVKWADYAYSGEGNILFNFGIEGESYTMKDGIPTYTDKIMRDPTGLPVNEAIGRYAVPMGYPMLQSIHYFNQYMAEEQKTAINIWKEAETSRTVPVLKYDAKEADTVQRQFNEIKNYNSEMFNKFITGKEPLDNFDKYLKTIENMGIADVIKAKQQAYDRYISLK
jgi:putative aldouronate transport system substrate-binding protein